MASLKKLFCNFKFPIYELSFDGFAQEIILQLKIPNIWTVL